MAFLAVAFLAALVAAFLAAAFLIGALTAFVAILTIPPVRPRTARTDRPGDDRLLDGQRLGFLSDGLVVGRLRRGVTVGSEAFFPAAQGRSHRGRKHLGRPSGGALAPAFSTSVPSMARAETPLRCRSVDPPLPWESERRARPSMTWSDGGLLLAGQFEAELTRDTCEKAWGKLPDQPAGHRVVLLGQQPEIVAQPEEPVEELAGVVVAPEHREAVGQPERTGQKGTFAAGQPVDVAGVDRAVAQHESAIDQLALDGLDGAPDPRVRAGRNPTSGIMSRLASSWSDP